MARSLRSKNSAAGCLFAVCTFALIIGCSSASKLSTTPTPSGTLGQTKVVVPTAAPIEVSKAGGTTLVARALTSLGDNRQPRFSPDGAKLLFLSSSRPSHRHTQIYELDLLHSTERRVTFHDGDDEGASWETNAHIVYSSVTDEIKEDVSMNRVKAVYESSRSVIANPNGIRPPPKVINGGEIYRQRLDGRAIERLTEKAGPDVSPTADSSGHGLKIVFVSSRSGDPQLYLYNGSTTRSISNGPDTSPSLSNDGQLLAWERAVPGKEAQSQIFMSENFRQANPLTSPGFRDLQPSWNAKSDSVIFVSNRSGKGTDLYLIDRKASCLKRLTEVQGDLSWPSMSPDGTKIAFSSRVGGVNQVFVMDDRSSSLPCLASIDSGKPPAK